MQPTIAAAIGAAQAGPVPPAFEVHGNSPGILTEGFPCQDPYPRVTA